MNPYMSMLLQALCDILESLAAGSVQNPTLWLSTVETLTKSFENDDGGESTQLESPYTPLTHDSQYSGVTTSWPR